MRIVAFAACVLALAAACGGDDDVSAPVTTAGEPTTAPETMETETVTAPATAARIATDEGEVVFTVEIADDPEERQLGLMHRESLLEDAGMIFLFEENQSGGFWMKNTLIPLSIAFVDAEGTILRLLDMQPCEADPCEIYDPGVIYRSALEVNEGAFDRLGVAEGDRLTLE